MMKKVFAYCVIAVVALTLGACTPKVEKATLDKKIENRDPEKLDFTTEEYAFMADYLTKHFDEIGDNDEEATKFVYLILLGEADDKGLLKGKVKKQFSELNQKFDERVTKQFSDMEKTLDERMQNSNSESVEEVDAVFPDSEDEHYSYEETEGDPPIGY